MIQPITKFEYDKIDWSELSKNHTKIDKIKNSLDKLEKQGFNPFSFTANEIRARQYVGVISLAGEVIQVLPKVFNTKEDSESQKTNIKGLMYLLQLTKKLKISETDISKLSEKIDSLLEIFIYLFAANLLELLQNNFHRSYVNQEENLKYVKGKIIFTEHIRHNYIDKSKFYCNYDEYEDNVLLNQIFKATINKCIKVSKTNFNLLQKCDQLLSNVEDKIFNNPNICKQIKFNKLNQRYTYVFELAKLLLFGNSPNMDSNNLNTFSIMFDMNKLFEESIYEIIKENKQHLGIKELKREKQEEIFDNNSSCNFTMKPDIYLEKNDGEKIIIDTKYKLLETIKADRNSNQRGISQADIYQVFAYSQYYKANKCVLLYPKFNWDNNQPLLKNDKQKFNLQISLIDLTLQDEKFAKYKQDILDQISNILNFDK